MDSRFKRWTTATALFVVFAVGQTYLTVSLARSVGVEPSYLALPQQPRAILTTAGNKSISVSGAPAVSGATVLSGALIETPDQVGANIDIPGHSNLQISAKAKLVLTYDGGNIKVTLIQGCVTLHTKTGVRGEIHTEKGKELGKTDPAKDGDLRTCEAIPGGGGGVSPAVIGLIGAGVAVGAIVALAGGDDTPSTNPSPSAP